MSQTLFDVFFIELVNMIESSTSNDTGDALRKIEELGYSVGQGMFEKHSTKLLFTTSAGADGVDTGKSRLDIIKFICKDIWQIAFGKQIDNLRTNHRGTYLLQDNAFRSFVNLGHSDAEQDKARLILAFPCGIIRGGLASVGLDNVQVRGELATLPACKFNLKIVDASTKAKTQYDL